MGRKYGMGYWLKEIMKEDKTYGREHLLKIADEFLSRDERKAHSGRTRRKGNRIQIKILIN